MRNSLGRNFTFGILQQLGQEIVTGAYGRSNPFPTEAELCKRLGASRSVLREAVKMLTAKGLLRARPRQGTWVEPEENWNLLDPDVLRWLMERKFSAQLLLEFTQIRLAMEPMAAALAARHADVAAKAKIRQAMERMKAADKGEDDPLTSDIAFHVAILEASGNRFYAQLRDIIEAALRTSIQLTNRRKGVRLASVADHQKVADAIFGGDIEGARQSMHALMMEAMTLIEAAANGTAAEDAV
ncbi:FadR/GntR family transcriptional regulator [Niveispirillum irakense]|uniref:FadR/GntR family transcriptional regulator n=1 Tax=Niveispirillum irakense TaxID=34011 RepID=UPI0003F87B4E|nr:FadR/GntR family transcriptional regulator [Niveispirillum irakense]